MKGQNKNFIAFCGVVKRFAKLENEDQILEKKNKKKLEIDRITYAKVLSRIQNAISPTIFSKIIKATSAKQAWEILEEQFKKTVKRDQFSLNHCAEILQLCK